MLGATLLGLVVLALGGRAALNAPLPAGVPGAEAEELTDTMFRGVDAEAWAETGAVTWTFAGRNQHLWDRQRALDRVAWGEVEVLVDLNSQTGRATRAGEAVEGKAAERLIAKAYAAWINDAFWLNPVVKARDEGVVRATVAASPPDEASRGLLVSYSSGGLTPGDSYLWLVGPDGRPVAWRMWVSIIPIGGLRASWEGWTQLSTGAWVSTEHRAGPVRLLLTDVAGAATLADLVPGPDPFAALVGAP